ncbi:MAG: thioredoxin [Bacteroidota bacterium]|nr:thioredoxin [Bacteroidota bacterium]
MLYTNLKHIETAADYRQIISEQNYVMICYGRMGFKSISVYDIMEKVQKRYRHVKFYDMEFDNPESKTATETQDCKESDELPYVIYYKNGEAVQITSGQQTEQQIVTILNNIFGKKTTTAHH